MPNPSPAPRSSTSNRLSLTVLAALLAALAGCGGGGDAAAPVALVIPSPTPPAASTTVTGAVVKGPVSGAQVCAYAVVANARGTALGSCTTTDANGKYSFAVPAGSGPLWLEANGGTYIDEVTNAASALAAGSPLVALITATGGTATSMLTPLTTLALNAARTGAGANGTLDAAAVDAAAAQLLSAFNLPASLNLATTLPGFGASANAYGAALTAVSRMVVNGLPLAQILAATQPSALAAAYAAAANPPVTPPPTSSGPPSASGTVTVAGVTAAGAATSLTPQVTGFEVAVKDTSTSYRFFRETSSPLSKVEIKVTVPAGAEATVSYYDLANSRSLPFCSSNCGVTITAAAGTTHPVTVSFNNTPLSGGLTLSGNLVGDAPGALWGALDLPRTTAGTLTVAGASVAVVTATDSTLTSGSFSQRTVTLRMADSTVVVMQQQAGGVLEVQRIQPPASVANCASACNATVTDTAGSSRVTFNNTPLGGGLVLSGSVDIGMTTGTLTSSDLGSFTPVTGTVESLNSRRTVTFNVLGTAAQAGLSLVQVALLDGVVVEAAATVGIATQVLKCFSNGAAIGVPACTGITVGADGRTVSFSNAVLAGGAVGQAARHVTFNGTVVAKGM